MRRIFCFTMPLLFFLAISCGNGNADSALSSIPEDGRFSDNDIPYVIKNISSFTCDSYIEFEWETLSENEVDYFEILSESGGCRQKIHLDGEIRGYKYTRKASEVAGETVTFSFTPVFKDNSRGRTEKLKRAFMPKDTLYSLPVMSIETENHIWPTAENAKSPYSFSATITNNNYVNAQSLVFSLSDGTVLYSSDIENRDRIKIRGNSSARSEKKPYKIKLDKKKDLLKDLVSGRETESDRYKHKEWLLLAKGTGVTDIIGFAASEYLGLDWTPSYAYIDLVINGDYQGTYILCESVDRGKGGGENRGRVNISDDGFLVENDLYFWNEPLSFRTDFFDMNKTRWTFKYPDADELVKDSPCFLYIKKYISDFEKALVKDDDSYKSYIDEETFVRWLLVHDFLCTSDECGSNMFLTKYDNTESSRLRMGPAWDFDSILSRKKAFSAIHDSDFFYVKSLMKKNSFSSFYREAFDEKKDGFKSAVLSCLNALDAEAINHSRTLNSFRWGSTIKTVESQRDNFAEYIDAHINWLDEKI